MTRTARTSWFFSREGERPAYTSTQCILPAGDALPAFQTIPLEFEPFEFQIPTSRSGFAILRSYPVLFGSNHRYSSIDLNLAIPPGTTNQAFQPLLIARDSGLRALRLHDVPLRSRLRFANGTRPEHAHSRRARPRLSRQRRHTGSPLLLRVTSKVASTSNRVSQPRPPIPASSGLFPTSSAQAYQDPFDSQLYTHATATTRPTATARHRLFNNQPASIVSSNLAPHRHPMVSTKGRRL